MNNHLKSRKNSQFPQPGLVILMLSILIACFVLIPQLKSVGQSLEAIKSANIPLIVVAIVCTFATYVAAAFTLKFIALKRLKFNVTLQIQAASGFATKLTPAGVGGFALNTRYLHKQKHSVVQASSVLALNGLLGFIGHVLIILSALVFAEKTLKQTVSFSISPLFFVVFAVTAVLFITVLTRIKRIKSKLPGIARQLKELIILFINYPKRLLLGFCGALAVTLLYTLTLFLSAAALNVELNFLQSLLVFTAGAIGASVTPTPGGLGGAEAALTAALIAVGVESSLALSVALIYRVITYWLPILPGLLFFNIALRKQYI